MSSDPSPVAAGVDVNPADKTDDKQHPDESASASTQSKASALLTFVNELKESLLSSSEATADHLDALDLASVAKLIKSGKIHNIITMTGAGISTSAGIPDFRSPHTGLYANLAKFNLPDPKAIFHIDFFKKNPEPFFTLSKDLFPKTLKPTPCHYFIRLLHEKNLLLRDFTQNIDSLEYIAGTPAEKIVEAHGSHHTNSCMECKKVYNLEWLREKLSSVKVPRCEFCDGVVKPDVVFFGEALPERFFISAIKDFPRCDLLLIMGTSLVVQPFCSLVSQVGERVPRVLINMEKAGEINELDRLMGVADGLDFDNDKDGARDIFCEGTCDDRCMEFATLLGWEKELKNLIENGWKKIEREVEIADAAKAEETKSANWPPDDQSDPESSKM